MAQVAKSKMSLRICGDDLVPEEITQLLEASPTQTKRKGDKKIGEKTGRELVARTGMWMLEATDCEPEDMNDQIEEILARLTSDLEVWKSIGERLRVDLFCGLFLKGANEGLTLSPRSLSKLGMRGIELNLDIYSGEEEGTSRAAACR